MNTKQPFDPKEILNSIELPDDLDRLIGDSVEKGYERMRRKTKIKKGFWIYLQELIIVTKLCEGVKANDSRHRL